MNEIEEEAYELSEQHKLAQNMLQAVDEDKLIDMLTVEESAKIAVASTTFENSNLVAYSLTMTEPTIAKALYEELKYGADNGRF